MICASNVFLPCPRSFRSARCHWSVVWRVDGGDGRSPSHLEGSIERHFFGRSPARDDDSVREGAGERGAATRDSGGGGDCGGDGGARSILSSLSLAGFCQLPTLAAFSENLMNQPATTHRHTVFHLHQRRKSANPSSTRVQALPRSTPSSR